MSNPNWLKDLFIDEAKPALTGRGGVSDEQVSAAIDNYLDKHPLSSVTAKIENGVLKIK